MIKDKATMVRSQAGMERFVLLEGLLFICREEVLELRLCFISFLGGI